MTIIKTKEERDKLTPAEKVALYKDTRTDLVDKVELVDTTQFLRRIGLVVFKR
jgi:hypothetical protein